MSVIWLVCVGAYLLVAGYFLIMAFEEAPITSPLPILAALIWPISFIAVLTTVIWQRLRG